MSATQQQLIETFDALPPEAQRFKVIHLKNSRSPRSLRELLLNQHQRYKTYQ